MIVEGEFFAGERLRWNLGWLSPNYAGAFLVTLLPLLWALNTTRWVWRPWRGKAPGFLLLAKTYSRGALASQAGSI